MPFAGQRALGVIRILRSPRSAAMAWRTRYRSCVAHPARPRPRLRAARARPVRRRRGAGTRSRGRPARRHCRPRCDRRSARMSSWQVFSQHSRVPLAGSASRAPDPSTVSVATIAAVVRRRRGGSECDRCSDLRVVHLPEPGLKPLQPCALTARRAEQPRRQLEAVAEFLGRESDSCSARRRRAVPASASRGATMRAPAGRRRPR